MSKTKRQSGIELLRIIAMIQIIFLHAYQYGLLHDASKAAGDIDGILGHLYGHYAEPLLMCLL